LSRFLLYNPTVLVCWFHPVSLFSPMAEMVLHATIRCLVPRPCTLWAARHGPANLKYIPDYLTSGNKWNLGGWTRSVEGSILIHGRVEEKASWTKLNEPLGIRAIVGRGGASETTSNYLCRVSRRFLRLITMVLNKSNTKFMVYNHGSKIVEWK
jgi:hypothetical protein